MVKGVVQAVLAIGLATTLAGATATGALVPGDEAPVTTSSPPPDLACNHDPTDRIVCVDDDFCPTTIYLFGQAVICIH